MDAVSERKVLGRIYGNLAVWIPACAGETTSGEDRTSLTQVHPRVRGGDLHPGRVDEPLQGPSPRARGRLASQRPQAANDGSIPACAGETRCYYGTAPRFRVHPRVRGGDAWKRAPLSHPSGPSPRARGRPGVDVVLRGWHGSIPACAGETEKSSSGYTTSAVHPRVRGGDTSAMQTVNATAGPSPRARGRHFSNADCECYSRSIPACAGETCSCVFE